MLIMKSDGAAEDGSLDQVRELYRGRFISGRPEASHRHLLSRDCFRGEYVFSYHFEVIVQKDPQVLKVTTFKKYLYFAPFLWKC